MATYDGSYMYLLKEREFVNSGEDVVKTGFSEAFSKRMLAYPKGSIVLATLRVSHGRSTERMVLAALRSRFKSRRDIGAEYFEGPLREIVSVFHETCNADVSDVVTTQMMPATEKDTVPATYECKRCGYTSVKRTDLLRHLDNKTTCPPTSTDAPISAMRDELLAMRDKSTTCPKCGKFYPLRTNMLRHAKTCTHDILGMERLQRTVDELKDRLATTEAAIEIKPRNSFGQEDVSYLTRDESDVQERFFRRSDGVFKTIEDIYFHADHPENNTVRMRSMKLGTSEIFVNGVWKLAITKNIVAQMLERSFDILVDRFARDVDYREHIMKHNDDVFAWQMTFRTRQIRKDDVERVTILLANKRNQNA